MYTDAQNRPSLNQSLALAAGTYASTDSVDLLTANRNIGRAFTQRAHAALTTALASGTSVQAQLIESPNANLSSPTVLASGPVITTANGTIGAKLFDAPIPGTTKRYIGFQYIVVGTMTTGAVTAHVGLAETDNQPYPVMNTGL
jgi:hypothetical protein